MLKTIFITICIAGLVLFILFILVLGKSLDAGFREKFPMDYLICLSDYIKAMKENGWQETGYSNAGSDHPSVIFTKDGINAELVLDAPIGNENYDKILIIDGVKVTLKDIDHLKAVIAQFEPSVNAKAIKKV